MSHIFLQKDNITILGDIYEYKVTSIEEDETSVLKQLATHLQIIMVVNGKQKIFKVNYDLESFSKEINTGEGKTFGECNSSARLKDYRYWYDLKEFLLAIGYDIEELNITNKLEKALEEYKFDRDEYEKIVLNDGVSVERIDYR